LEIRVDTYDFDIILACFWLNDQGIWEGVITKDLEKDIEAKIIISDRIALVIRRPPPQSSDSHCAITI
jgi:hypothetical protein